MRETSLSPRRVVPQRVESQNFALFSLSRHNVLLEEQRTQEKQQLASTHAPETQHLKPDNPFGGAVQCRPQAGDIEQTNPPPQGQHIVCFSRSHCSSITRYEHCHPDLDRYDFRSHRCRKELVCSLETRKTESAQIVNHCDIVKQTENELFNSHKSIPKSSQLTLPQQKDPPSQLRTRWLRQGDHHLRHACAAATCLGQHRIRPLFGPDLFRPDLFRKVKILTV